MGLTPAWTLGPDCDCVVVVVVVVGIGIRFVGSVAGPARRVSFGLGLGIVAGIAGAAGNWIAIAIIAAAVAAAGLAAPAFACLCAGISVDRIRYGAGDAAAAATDALVRGTRHTGAAIADTNIRLPAALRHRHAPLGAAAADRLAAAPAMMPAAIASRCCGCSCSSTTSSTSCSSSSCTIRF